MPIHGYSGGVISATSPTVSPTSASGVWTLDDQLQNAANWPSQSNIARSLRFNSADSAYLNRTFTTPTNNTTWSFSFWLKRSTLSTQQYFLNVNSYGGIGTNNDSIVFWGNTGLSLATSTAVFRDVSAWYHVMVVSNGTTITAYVNNSSVLTYTGTITNLNSAVVHNIGRDQTSASAYLNGYMADVYFIDGQALTPSSFGYTDSNGIWQPNSYTGSYGTNGFWLNFDDNSGTTATTLGKDSSGNGNNWTPNNFSVTAGAGNDSLVDSPTNYGTDTGVGGEVRGNYCTLNPLDLGFGIALANGNLDVTNANSTHRLVRGTFAFPASGKWYAEARVGATTSGTSAFAFGFGTNAAVLNSYNAAGQYLLYASSAREIANNAAAISLTGGAFSAGDILQIAIDIDGSKVWFGLNNVWYNSSGGTTGDPAAGTNATIAVNASGMLPMCDVFNGTTANSVNFGQRPFAYTAPAGFKALCSTNLPTPTIQKGADYFNTGLWTGNTSASNIAVTGIGFKPDFFWGKLRSAATGHRLIDSIRGVTKILNSNGTGAESTETDAFASFDTDGFTIGKDTTGGGLNYNTNTGVGWVWKGGGTGVSNTAGSITSTVSANQTSGFSVVTYTGTGSAATVGHGLGAAPSMVIVKRRNGAVEWPVYHVSVGNNKYLYLDTTAAAATFAMWNNTTPTSSVFSIGVASDNNANTGTYVAYCFAPVSGYSAFGSYTGNGSADGPFIYTGFRPRYLLLKNASSTYNWVILDTVRSTYNIVGTTLWTNLSNAEGTFNAVDILSNGFKLRANSTDNPTLNNTNDTIIYAAFAENPFKIARAR